MNWNKKNISANDVRTLQNTYGLNALAASIFLRREITQPTDILYYLESDLRYLHNPFLFHDMEDAVDLILDTIEDGGKILIFGDKDVDGVSSTAILYTYLKKIGADVQWRLPLEGDAYGLSMQAVEDFAREYGSLIITVDCGISNNIEIARAAELGLSVIVTDHHIPRENLPSPAIIIDPKIDKSGYPFDGISGAAVAFKLISALRFAKSDFYKQEICLMTVENSGGGGNTNSSNEGAVSATNSRSHAAHNTQVIKCRKLRNLLRRETLSLEINENITSVLDTKLPHFLAGQQIFVWDAPLVKKQLAEIFGSGIEFNVIDLKGVCTKFIQGIQGKSIADIKNASKALRYTETEPHDIDALETMFIAYARQEQKLAFPQEEKDIREDLELVAMAALADIMPLQNENRILVKNGIANLNSGYIRQGLAELFARLSFRTGNINSVDLSWTVIPCLNAAGRIGQADIALKLLISEAPKERDAMAAKIIEMNEKRKTLVNEATTFTAHSADESFSKHDCKLCAVVDGRIHHGVTGLVAARLVSKYNVPAIAVTLDGKTATGSMRSCRGLNSTEFLSKFGDDFFINYGGHNYASGFSFEQSKLDEYLKKLETISKNISLAENSSENEIFVDAELPPEYLTPDILKTLEIFEPFGEENQPLVFMSRSLRIEKAEIVGKAEPLHLKLTLDCGKHKFPAMMWRMAEKLEKDFKVEDKVDVLYTIEKNSWGGTVTPQIIIKELKTEI